MDTSDINALVRGHFEQDYNYRKIVALLARSRSWCSAVSLPSEAAPEEDGLKQAS